MPRPELLLLELEPPAAGFAERGATAEEDWFGAPVASSSLSDASEGMVRFSFGRGAPEREPDVFDRAGGGNSGALEVDCGRGGGCGC
jgi:hypothetical protein